MSSTTIEIEGRSLRLSNLEKVLYPEDGFTKGEVLDWARAQPTVSVPLHWDEVEAAAGGDSLPPLDAASVLGRVALVGDLFADVLNCAQILPHR